MESLKKMKVICDDLNMKCPLQTHGYEHIFPELIVLFEVDIKFFNSGLVSRNGKLLFSSKLFASISSINVNKLLLTLTINTDPTLMVMIPCRYGQHQQLGDQVSLSDLELLLSDNLSPQQECQLISSIVVT